MRDPNGQILSNLGSLPRNRFVSPRNAPQFVGEERYKKLRRWVARRGPDAK